MRSHPWNNVHELILFIILFKRYHYLAHVLFISEVIEDEINVREKAVSLYPFISSYLIYINSESFPIFKFMTLHSILVSLVSPLKSIEYIKKTTFILITIFLHFMYIYITDVITVIFRITFVRQTDKNSFIFYLKISMLL
jgi:uncharacterized protein YqhQ